MDRNIKNEPPGGKINFPFSVSTKVVSGSPLRTNALTPPLGSPITFDANCNFIFGLGSGRMEVLVVDMRVDSIGVPGGTELNQNWARNVDSDISETVLYFQKGGMVT